MSKAFITEFRHVRPRFEKAQEEIVDWLVMAHGAYGAPREKILRRVCCSPEKVGFRGHETELDFHETGTEARTLLFRDAAILIFEKIYDQGEEGPADLIHVTCTGYVSPSPAQIHAQNRGWSRKTKVTHAYHMGCYGAFPAVRQALGFLKCSGERVDVVHTEMCSLHVNPQDHGLEQMVIQSLFADGFIRYSLVAEAPQGLQAGLEVLTVHEELIPETTSAMTWITGDLGMKMTLSKEVPTLISAELRGFLDRLMARGGLVFEQEKGKAIFVVHPGGPKIVAQVSETLNLDWPQTRHSRQILFDYGNMSSATVPHIWERVLKDQEIIPGTLIISLAFGPGLTICGSLMVKR